MTLSLGIKYYNYIHYLIRKLFISDYNELKAKHIKGIVGVGRYSRYLRYLQFSNTLLVVYDTVSHDPNLLLHMRKSACTLPVTSCSN